MKKKLCFTLLLVSYYCSLQAQRIQFTYDDVGNRTKREHCSCRLTNPGDSIKEKAAAAKYGLKVFPNPTANQVNINISKLEDGVKANIILFDEQGKLLFTKEQNSAQDFIDLQKFSGGFYFLKITIGGDALEYKIQKLE